MRIVLKAAGNAYWENDRLTFAAIDEDIPPNTIVGAIDLYNRDALNQRAEVGIVVDENYRRKGYATEMLRQLILLVSDMKSLHQIYADIVTSNLVSQRLFSKAGFMAAGTLREWIFDGEKYEDVVRYQLILNE